MAEPAFVPPPPDPYPDVVEAGFSVILHYDPMMVAELAMGADPPYEIAERYGLEAEDLDLLMAQSWFNRLVAQKRTEFHDTGVLFQAKAGMMAEALLTRLFQQSMAGAIAAPLIIEVTKQLSDIGRLKPQPLNTMPSGGGGPGFQINIQVNGADVVRKDAHLLAGPVDVTPSPAAPNVSSLSGDSAAVAPVAPGSVTRPGPDKAAAKPTLTLDFPPPPAHVSNLRTPDFDMRPGLGTAPPGVGLPPRPPLG